MKAKGREFFIDSFGIARRGIVVNYNEINILIKEQLQYPQRIRKNLPESIHDFEKRVQVHVNEFETTVCQFLLRAPQVRAFTRIDVLNAKAKLNQLIKIKKLKLDQKTIRLKQIIK